MKKDAPEREASLPDGVPGDPRSTTCSLHVNTEPTWRGGEQQTLYLVQGLARRGHKVVLCAQAASPLTERARAAGIETIPMRMRGEVDPVAVAQLLRLMRRLRPDVVHYHTSHAHTLAAAAALFLGRGRPRTILTRRVDFSIFRHTFLGLNGLKYRLVDHIVAISEAVKRVLLADGIPAERIDVVPSGVDPERFARAAPHDLRREFGLPPDTKVILNIAYLADHKGQRYLIEAAPRILREFPAAAFVFVGEGELRQALIDLSGKLAVNQRVFFTGFRHDIAPILRGADIYVMPSHLEGLGTSILDALSCGLPVVATRAGGIPEMIEDGVNGLLVPPRDAEALGEAVLRLLLHPEECAHLGGAGPATVEARFTADRMVEGNLAIYRRLLAGGKGA